jgi:oligoribonuclease (3'-5' exoribonuclease)
MHPILFDLETTGLTPGSAILEIAAATFDINTGTIHETFHTHIDLFDSAACGLTICPDTAKFHHLLSTPLPKGPTLWAALSSFSLWVKDQNAPAVWAWGADFDRPILSHALHLIHATLPWQYWETRDARTVWALAFPGQKHPKRTHQALPDVLASIHDLTRAYNHLTTPLLPNP